VLPDVLVAEIVSSVRHEVAGTIERCFYWLAMIRRVAEEPETDLSGVLSGGTADVGDKALELLGELEAEFRQLEQSMRKLRLGPAIGRSDSPDA
jgi:hypothetical protein